MKYEPTVKIEVENLDLVGIYAYLLSESLKLGKVCATMYTANSRTKFIVAGVDSLEDLTQYFYDLSFQEYVKVYKAKYKHALYLDDIPFDVSLANVDELNGFTYPSISEYKGLSDEVTELAIKSVSDKLSRSQLVSVGILS